MSYCQQCATLQRELAAEKALYEDNERAKVAELTTANKRIKELEQKMAKVHRLVKLAATI